MMKNILFIALALLVFCTFTHESGAQQVDAPIVVELFTSQGCPSCPPADRILHDLAQNNNIIALGCHVSYFDRAQWKDELSQEFCDIRQHGYVGTNGEKRIYTPQMVVNGANQFIGYEKDKVQSALEIAKNAPIQSIQINMKDPQTISFALPNIAHGSYRLWAFGYKRALKEDIKSEENNKKLPPYTNPVLSYTNLGSWQGGAMTNAFPMPSDAIDGIAILAQTGGYSEIIAAGKLDF